MQYNRAWHYGTPSRYGRDDGVNIKDSTARVATPSVKIRRHPRRAEYNAAKRRGTGVEKGRTRSYKLLLASRAARVGSLGLISPLSARRKEHFLSAARWSPSRCSTSPPVMLRGATKEFVWRDASSFRGLSSGDFKWPSLLSATALARYWRLYH